VFARYYNAFFYKDSAQVERQSKSVTHFYKQLDFPVQPQGLLFNVNIIYIKISFSSRVSFSLNNKIYFTLIKY